MILRRFMQKTLFVYALLVSIALFSKDIGASDNKPVIEKIGFVLYSKTSAPGTLSARWMYGNKYRGSGIATGGPKDGYAGKYHVRYFYENGDFSDEYKLEIKKVEDIYEVYWYVDDELGAIGVGMEVENGLAVGWYR